MVGGGGLSAASQIIIGKKAQFAIISEEEPEDKYGLPISEALFTSPGGITDNTVDVTATGGVLDALIAGGGSFSNAKYSLNFSMGALISGNQVKVGAATSEGDILVGGGGAALVPLLDDEPVLFSNWKYSVITDNSVTVSGSSDLAIEAFGGGLGIRNEDGGGPDEPPLSMSLAFSEVSGNSIALTSDNGDSRAIGGGIAAGRIDGVEDSGKYAGPAHLHNSTVANNSLSISGDGDFVAGAGVFLDVKYVDGDDESGIINTTIAGNTGSRDGEPEGGQLWLELSLDDDDGFKLHNSIISGETAQGDTDIYYDPAPDLEVEATAVFHGIESPIEGFLDPAIADPLFLGQLQFNGSDIVGDGDKYGFFPTTATIALLPGSGAIDPSEEASCISAETLDDDQRGYPRDECPDLGAYERTAEDDGDGLVDDAELDAPGTDPVILAEMGSFPPPYGILLASGDGNSDGIPDVDQDHVASFNSESAGALTLYVTESGGPDLGSVTPVPGMMAGGLDLSLGGVSFTVQTGSGTSPVELSLIAPVQDGFTLSLVKQVCNPAPPGPDEGWEVLDGEPEPFGDGRLRFTFELEPDGPFDCNGSDPNIEDPIYLARTAVSAIPTMPAMLYGLLSGALGVLGMLGLRARKKKSAR